jgi:hypothetical protein
MTEPTSVVWVPALNEIRPALNEIGLASIFYSTATD